MKLHWSPRSPYVRKVMMVAYETALVGRLQLVRSVAAMTKPNAALMQDNPLSKIPTLVRDDGVSLFDSAVICEYLDSMHRGPRLFPEAGPARWQALRWHALGDGLLDVLILWRNERQREPSQQSNALLQAFELKTRRSLEWLEREADGLRAAPFTIGHIGIGCALGYLDFRFGEVQWRGANARLARWAETFALRPSALKTLPHADE